MTTLDADCFYTCAKGNLTAKRSKSFKYVVILKQIVPIYQLSYTLKLIADDKKKIDFRHIPSRPLQFAYCLFCIGYGNWYSVYCLIQPQLYLYSKVAFLF